MRRFLPVVFLLIAVNVWAIEEDYARIKGVANKVCLEAKAKTDEEKVVALSHFVFEKLKPDYSKGIPPNAGMSVCDRLDVGVGWCNHQVDVFMYLAASQGIKTRMLYLINYEGTASPHTIGEAWVNSRWVIVDPSMDLDMRNEKGELISLRDLQKDIQVLRKNKYFNEMKDEWLENFLNPVMYVKDMGE